MLRIRSRGKIQLTDEVIALRRRSAELELRNRIAEIFLVVPDNRMYREVLGILLEATDSEHGVFGYIDEDGAYVVPWAAADAGNELPAASRVTVFPRNTWGDTAGARAVREKRTISSATPSDATYRRAASLAPCDVSHRNTTSNNPLTDAPDSCIPICRQISLPILHRGEVIGLIQVANKDVDYSEADITFLETMAGAIAPALSARLRRERQEKVRDLAEEALRQACRELEKQFQEQARELARATRDLHNETAARTCAEDRSRRHGALVAAAGRILQDASTCVNEEEVAGAFLALAQQLTGSRFGYFARAAQDGRFDVITLADTDWNAYETVESNRPVWLGSMNLPGIWGRVLKEGKSHIVNGPVSYPDWLGVPEGHPPVASFLGVPFVQGGSILATIALANKPSGYDDTDREIMEALSPIIVAVLTHKRTEALLYEAQQNLVRRGTQVAAARPVGRESHERPAAAPRRAALKGGVDQTVPVNTTRPRPPSRYGRIVSSVSEKLARLRKAGKTGKFRKVLVASPQPAFQSAVKLALQGQEKVTVVETGAIGEGSLRMARDAKPDVVVVDLSSAGMSGFRTISLLRDQLSGARIVAVSPYDSKSIKYTARECGADELVLGSVQGRDLVQAVRRALLAS